MAYEKQTWGTYQYDEAKSFKENLEAAEKANALVTTDKIKHIEQGIADKAEKGEKGDPGNPGAPGKDATGKPGAPGKDAKQIKSGVINEDKNGVVTGIKVTFTDNSTVDFSVKKATE